MNCTKLIPPSPSFLSFFYYYSYFVLFATLAIVPLQIYVVLTKSQEIKKLKWLILNHTIWCLLFEIFFTSVKPIFLSPTWGVFLLGLFRNGNFKTTALASYFGLLIGAISIAALISTLRSRYLLVFPAANWYKPKRGMILQFFLLTLVSVPLGILFLPFLFMDFSEIYEMAFNYDPCLQQFLREPSFLFISPQRTGKIFIFEFSLMIFVLISAISIAIYFIFLVKTNSTATTTKLSTSLMVSSVVQLSITICFYIIPISAFFGIIAFQIPNTENFMIVVICTYLTHSFLEFIATLYFVRPYRKAIGKLLRRFNPMKIVKKNITQISTASNIIVYN